MMVVVAPRGEWGTWEELILGGAVRRHGTQAWDAVASELQARTLYPFSFTPETCKAKYEDLKQRYSGCTAWFEELRKRRVAELRHELEKSEDSIGSLESKLESLKAGQGDYSHVDYVSIQNDSPGPVVKSEGVEYCGKDTSKDVLSAGSFTHDVMTNWLPGCQNLASTSVAEVEAEPEVSNSLENGKLSSMRKLAETSNERGGIVRKRRGKRKRKDCSVEPKEESVVESENLGSTTVIDASSTKENSTSDCGPTIRPSSNKGHSRGSYGIGNGDLKSIFDSIAENDNALVFRRRLDGQKRARYRKTIRQHVDLDTIRSRIASCTILSVKELFRDLLLLANNALVFYSKRTREYKTAILLRDIFTQAYQQHSKDSVVRAASPIFPLSPICNPPVKPRSVRPRIRKPPSNLTNSENVVADAPGPGTPQRCKKPSNVENVEAGGQVRCKKPSNAEMVVSGTPQAFGPCVEPLMMARKGFIRIGKLRRGVSSKRTEAPMKEWKRARRRLENL